MLVTGGRISCSIGYCKFRETSIMLYTESDHNCRTTDDHHNGAANHRTAFPVRGGLHVDRLRLPPGSGGLDPDLGQDLGYLWSQTRAVDC
jgi:hypothetical protein